jgi:hypothetical protein
VGNENDNAWLELIVMDYIDRFGLTDFARRLILQRCPDLEGLLPPTILRSGEHEVDASLRKKRYRWKKRKMGS